MDDHKLGAILDWEPPRSVSTLISFLWLASYYCKFIKNFAKIATPLTNFLMKSFKIYEWDEACHETFETLKGILVKTPMLKLPDFDKKFKIQCDAYDFVIKGVLIEDGRLVAFENKKLNEIEQRWPTHGKEMWAMIHCLKTWGHYIRSKDVWCRPTMSPWNTLPFNQSCHQNKWDGKTHCDTPPSFLMDSSVTLKVIAQGEGIGACSLVCNTLG